MQPSPCDVLLIGCGPTGVVLANLLGQLGRRVVVLEREPEVYPVPRATHIDEETLRNFQATGLMPKLREHCAPFGLIDVVEGGAVLFQDVVGDPDARHGYSGSCFFFQPAFERILREGLARYPNVALHTGVVAEGIEARGDHVAVHARALSGEARSFRASWVVGCDGGQSLAREALKTGMERLAPKRHWLIVDAYLKDLADAARLPDHFRYFLGREQLSLYAHGFGAHRRWELQLPSAQRPGEAEVLAWISGHIDPARLEIARISVYAHQALLANTWRGGRLLLAGDAAHMMPPSAGQGMCSGIRDAVNLAWKLSEVVAGRLKPELLDTYPRERRPHVREVIRGTLFIGEMLEADGALARLRRRLALRLIGALRPLRELLRRYSLHRPPLRGGFLDHRPHSGAHLPQVEVRWRGGEHLLDDILGYRFALIARPGALSPADLDWAAARGIGVFRPGADFVEPGGALSRWMRDARLDFLLVRPDRQIFGAGDSGQLRSTRAAFDAWVVGPG
jgi:3-(3-hydroxy-phenyl)propionate hydroxylase